MRMDVIEVFYGSLWKEFFGPLLMMKLRAAIQKPGFNSVTKKRSYSLTSGLRVE